MGTGMARKMAELKQRVARLESQLVEKERALADRGAAQGRAALTDSGNAQIAVGNDRAAVQRAEALFTELLEMRPPRLISYSGAYRKVLGNYSVWRNAVHAPAVIGVACRTAPRRIGTVTVRLDALIVGKLTRRPAKGHYSDAAYSENDWIKSFGTWPLLE